MPSALLGKERGHRNRKKKKKRKKKRRRALVCRLRARVFVLTCSFRLVRDRASPASRSMLSLFVCLRCGAVAEPEGTESMALLLVASSFGSCAMLEAGIPRK